MLAPSQLLVILSGMLTGVAGSRIGIVRMVGICTTSVISKGGLRWSGRAMKERTVVPLLAEAMDMRVAKPPTLSVRESLVR